MPAIQDTATTAVMPTPDQDLERLCEHTLAGRDIIGITRGPETGTTQYTVITFREKHYLSAEVGAKVLFEKDLSDLELILEDVPVDTPIVVDMDNIAFGSSQIFLSLSKLVEKLGSPQQLHIAGVREEIAQGLNLVHTLRECPRYKDSSEAIEAITK